ncbi:MAG: TlpA family protein disulfide reductase [candidate division WOR-3 bacterium]|nr:MAG: TlpA family protein disulfide reductase [candidate division WOR-3 bacterium]
MNRYVAFILIGIMIVLACKSGERAASSGFQNDFTLESIDGESYTLSELKGNVIIVDFWATWCPPCRNSIPALIKLYDKYHARGFMILGISTEDINTLREFRDAQQIPYPILSATNEVVKVYEVTAIPKMFFFDKTGAVRKTQTGYSPELEPQFDRLVDSLLQE